MKKVWHMKKLVIGITSPSSIILIDGQLSFFSRNGYQTFLMCPKGGGVKEFCEREGCTHIPIDIDREINVFKDVMSLFSIFRSLRKIKPDIVNVGTPKMGLLGMLASRILCIKIRIYTCRGFRFEHENGVKREMLKFFEYVSALCAHKIICISPSVREFGIRVGLFPSEKCVVINKGSSNGFNLERFSRNNISLNKLSVLRRELSLNGVFVYGFVGRIVDRKGIKELYEAFDSLYIMDKTSRLLIVGSIELVQLQDKSLIDEIRNHPGIVFVGFQKEVSLYMSLMDVFVLPAWWEGFGNVLVQAAAMGIPVISTTGTGTCDAVCDGYNGILVPIKDMKALRGAMLKLKEDKNLALSYGNNGITWAHNFSNEVVWTGMDVLYKQLMQKKI